MFRCIPIIHTPRKKVHHLQRVWIEIRCVINTIVRDCTCFANICNNTKMCRFMHKEHIDKMLNVMCAKGVQKLHNLNRSKWIISVVCLCVLVCSNVLRFIRYKIEINALNAIHCLLLFFFWKICTVFHFIIICKCVFF